MEVFVRNLHDQVTEKQVNSFFRDVFEKLGVKVFHCQKLKGRGCATITIHDVGKARQFLSLHGQTLPGNRGFATVQRKLYHRGRQINCTKSNKEPDEFILRSLKKEESERYLKDHNRKPKIVPAKVENSNTSSRDQRAWDINDLKCGQWTYDGDDLAFASEYHERRNGRILFGHRAVRINLMPQNASSASHHVDIPYSSMQSFTIGPNAKPTITFSLAEAPRIFELLDNEIVNNHAIEIDRMIGALNIRPQRQEVKRKRTTALSQDHGAVISNCLCYRLMLSNRNDIAGVQALKKFPTIPDSISWNTSCKAKKHITDRMDSLKSALIGKKYEEIPFDVKFQLQKLAQNGYLDPKIAIALLAVVSRRIQRANMSTVIQSLRNLSVQIPFPGPDTEASELSLATLTENLIQSERSILQAEYLSVGLADQYDHIASVHKVTVTPAGIYLYGPEPEIKNRVLRKYSAFPNYFLSVSFLDEDGERLWIDRQTSGEDIFYGRYKKVLETGINIAGRQYEFLGFSHSSLRAQTCWFMAPFIMEGSLVFAQSVIKGLGDFTLIRSPAKCAARIGQAFSQTFSSVSIPPEAISELPDVKRNGRTFSDGVGTCSAAILDEVWKKFTQARGLKPTVLQIRFRGAKGVISLDSRLEGAALRLRKSMIKFEGTAVADIEICGAALKPLPMFLNRPMIKILEDLGVPAEAFLTLQADAVEKLRMTTLSAINASSFLERNLVGKGARLPWLIRKLNAIGFSFNDDDFLRNTLELAVLIELRQLKHKSRIRVADGVTLYGIMDETNFLLEDQVYCSMHTERGRQIIRGSVVVTRSPALHPGDVQCVTAVDVPTDSPLRALNNMVVFSSHGDRDLPSKLSGGDLDGDLYNVIYDDSLYPRKISDPADYPTLPPIDIGRTVERADMTDFFVKFMENDNLGLIAILHQIMADRSPEGTCDPICVQLANLHSTAVDFSKTGVPVDFSKLPKFPKARPDFLASGPRVLINKVIKFEEEEPDPLLLEDNDELDEFASYEPPRIKYYDSEKVLGRLYREIDEHSFFERMQGQSRSLGIASSKCHNLGDSVWAYVHNKAALIQWRHCLDFAKNVKESYEENLVDTMFQYSTHPPYFISEVEVFSGSILGKHGAQSKRQREFSKTMKDKHERDVEYTVSWITRGDDNNSRQEALERSIACLYIACNTTKVWKRVGILMSFTWVAATVCLRELEKLPGSTIPHA